MLHDDGHARLWAERRVRAVGMHRMQTRVEEDVPLWRSQKRRPNGREDLLVAHRRLEPRHERGADDVDSAGAEQNELDHVFST
jgi:hypothetical protein